MSLLIEKIDPEPTLDDSEAYRMLLARVGRKSQTIPAEILVRHVLRCVPDNEWPIRVDAMDALLRRLESGRRDELRIVSKPERGRVLGPYATRRRGSEVRPYRTVVRGVEPIEGSCDCPDFLKNSLGVCKHILIVVAGLYAKPRNLQQAIKEQASSETDLRKGLRWNPIRPLTGPGDWLERIEWSPDGESKGPRSIRARDWFETGLNGGLTIKPSVSEDPETRLAIVEDLLKILPSNPDPALHALLTRERLRLKLKRKLALPPDEQQTAFEGLKRSLYPYQRAGVERFLTEGRLLLADDMGLGKTAQAIASCDILWRTRRIKRGVIIAPASLKPQWAREWSQFSNLPIEVVDGSPSERAELYQSRRSGLFIINYEQLIRDYEIIRRWEPDLVVLDEAQRIKNWATKTALAVKELDPPYRLVMTGTPMENRIEELASIVEWVDDMALEPKWRLSPLHSIHADGKREVIGVRHLDTLRDRLRGCMVRRIRQDVLDQLPPRTDVRVPIELTESQQEEHDALIQPIVSLMQRAKLRPLTQAEFLRLMSLLTTQRIISNGLAQLQFKDVWPAIRSRPPEESVLKGLSSPKLLELRQLVREIALEQGRKIVIFSQWRRMLTLGHWAVSDLLKEASVRAGFFTGAEGQRRRTQNIVEFHDDPQLRLLFASDAGGVGLNLQHASNCVINLELPWNPAVLEQRIGRIYRLGQKQPIDVYNLVSEQGIESRIAGLVGSKQAFFKGLFDGESDSVQFDHSGSFLSRVEKLYEPATTSEHPQIVDPDELAPADPEDDFLDDEVADPFEPVVDAANEAADAIAAPSANGQGDATIVSPSDLADQPATAPEPSGESDVRHLFSRLQIRRETDGKIVIEAPADAASALIALFEGMAALLQSVASPPGPS